MKKIIALLIIPLFVLACSKDDKSSSTEITSANITDVSDSNLDYIETVIEPASGKIYLIFNNDLRDIAFPIILNADIRVSSGAKMSSFVNGELTFSNPDNVLPIEVTAEDGTSKNWYIYLVHKQLQNSDFEDWFDNKGLNGESYKEIGLTSVTSVWSTANMGTSTYSVYGSKPITVDGNTMVEIKTQAAGNLPITAGTVFTGDFSLTEAITHPTDPEKATLFGRPFIFRPTGFKFKFKYQAGENYIQATLINPTNIFGGFTTEDIPGEDKSTVYAYLEVRNGDEIKEIARTKLESGTTADIMTETMLNFTYTSSENPTHITIVFSSSTGGAEWRGAVGSTLVIDDLELVY